MRALCCFVVACLLAATGVRPADARADRGRSSPHAIARATPPAAAAVATRPAAHAIGGPNGRAHFSL
jgi:hypothetical protein